MNFLIVGANGFLGSLFTDYFSQNAENKVFAFDRFSRDSIFPWRSNVIRIQGEVSEISEHSTLLSDVDVVLHCFARTRPGFDSGLEDEIDRLEIQPSIELFSLCSRLGVPKVVYFSSGGAVYGELTNGKHSELQEPTPKSPYGVSKVKIENLLLELSVKSDIQVLILRVSNPYGPIQKHFNQGLVNTILKNIYIGETQVIYGDGSMIRDYIYASDLCKMVDKLVENRNKHRIYNLGSGIGTSVMDVIHEIENQLSIKVRVSNIDKPLSMLNKSILSIDRFNLEFGVQNRVDFRLGVRDMILEYTRK